jgi:integrase
MGIRFRTLRAVYNKAIEDDIVDEKYYPFKKFKVSHFNKKTTKRAISKSEMAKVLALDLSNITTYYSPLLYLSKDLFVFSYLGCGINMIDMAYLTYSNIIDDRICFKRHKTGQGITFRLLPQTIEIINKYKNEGYSLSDYIFPILDKKFHITEIQQYDRIRKVTKGVNRNLKKIGSFLGLNIPLTTYTAKHHTISI